MIQYAKASAAGVTLRDEAGVRFIPFQRRPKLHRRQSLPEAAPAAMQYHYFGAALKNSVLPTTFKLHP